MNCSIGTATEFQNKFRTLNKLGEGGYGAVYLCKELTTGITRAVKTVKDKICRNRTYIPTLNQTLPNEIVLWKPLNHPNIVSLLDVFLDTETDSWWMVMEYDAGFVDLFRYVDEKGALSSTESAVIINQLVDTTYYLTLHDVDHRDIKDENILYNPSTQQIKLIDFGSSAVLTHEYYNFFRGTDVYIPPEYFITGRYSPLHASTWAIGCLSYVLLAGDCPFTNREAVKEFKTIEDLNPDYTDKNPRLNFIRSCLKPSPEDRILLSELANHPWLDC